MAKPKKGALFQLLVPMVDATDFASIESGITESDFNSGATKKFWNLWSLGLQFRYQAKFMREQPIVPYVAFAMEYWNYQVSGCMRIVKLVQDGLKSHPGRRFFICYCSYTI